MKKFSILSSILLVLIMMLFACSQETTISVEEEIIGDPQKTAEQEKFEEVVKTGAAGTIAALATDITPTSEYEATPTIMPTEESIIPNPMFLLSSTDCTKSNWQFSYTRSFQRVDANSTYTVTGSNGYNATENMDWLTIGQSHTSNVDVNLDGGYAANFTFKTQYVGNDGSYAILIWNCETGEVLQNSWNPAD